MSEYPWTTDVELVVTTDAADVLGECLGRHRHLLRVRGVREPAVEPRRALPGTAAVAADPDRKRLLDRGGGECHSVDDVVRTAVLDLVAGPQPAQHVEPFVELLCAHLRIRLFPERLELGDDAAEAGTEDDAPSAQDVECRHLMCETCGRRRGTGVIPVPIRSVVVDAATAASVTHGSAAGGPQTNPR